MMENRAVSVKNISKRFRRYRDIGGYAVAVCSLDDRFPERIEQMQF